MKKLTAIIISIVMIIQTLPVLAYTPTSEFSDLTGFEYFADEVKEMSEKGIIKGYEDGSFGSDRLIERSEMAAFICRMLGKENEKSELTQTFTDVPDDFWAADNIKVAAGLGIIQGDGDGLFRPDDNILFEEAVKMIVAAAGLKDEAEEKGGWPEGYVKVANFYNLLTKNIKNYGEYVTRADVVTTIYNAIHKDERNLVEFGLPVNYKKTVADETVKGRFETRVSELPSEIRVLDNKYSRFDKEFFVAPDGNDETGDGTIEKPFATLNKALSKANEGTIYLRGGNYNNKEALKITNVNGTAQKPVVIKAYENEKPVIVGGVALKKNNFTSVTDESVKSRFKDNIKNSIVEADLKKAGVTKIPDISGSSYGTALTIDGEKGILSRYPNNSLLPIEKVIDKGPVEEDGEKDDGRGVTIGLVTDRTPFGWKDTGNIWVRAAFYWEWNQVYSPIKINYENNSFTTKYASYYGARMGPDKYFFYNVLEELDYSNEYFVDKDTLKLYLLPANDLKDDSNVYLSLINDAIVQVVNCSNIVFDGIEFTTSVGDGVSVKKSHDIIFQNCVFSECGQRGLHIYEDTKRTGAVSSYFVNNRNQNVRVETPDRAELVPTNNFVQNCMIFGNSDQVLNSLISFSGIGDVVSHNLFANGYATAIGVLGWEMVVENNETTASPKYQVDSGCVYGPGLLGLRASHIRSNFLHDTPKDNKNSMTCGIYFDAMAHDNMAYNNVLYHLPSGSFNNCGRNIVMFNNLYVDSNAGMENHAATISEIFMHNMDKGATQSYMGTILNQNSDFNTTPTWDERMPYYKQFFADLRSLVSQWKENGGEYLGNEFEETMRGTQDHYLANNVSVNAGSIGLTDYAAKRSIIGNNLVVPENNGYVTVSKDKIEFNNNEVFEKVPGFKVPDIKNMRILTEKLDREAKLGMFGGIKAISPRNGKKAEVYTKKVDFKWSDLFMATDYDFVLSTDKEFKNVVHKETLNKEYLTLDLPEAGQTYYWKVKAYTSAESIDQTPFESDVFSFTAMTDDEAAKYIKSDYGVLSSKIDIATTIINTASQRCYGEKEVAALKKIKDEAVEFTKTNHSTADTEAMTEKVKSAIFDAKKSEKYEYIDLDLKAENWKLTGSMTAENNEAGELVLTPNSGNPHAISVENTSYGKMYRFQMWQEGLNSWWGITPTYDFDVKSRYFFVMQPGRMECQKVISGTRVGFLHEGSLGDEIKPGVWQEVEIGNIYCDEGMWVFMRVDGKEVVNKIDTENIIEDDGGMQFLLNKANGTVKIRPSKIKDSELPKKPTK